MPHKNEAGIKMPVVQAGRSYLVRRGEFSTGIAKPGQNAPVEPPHATAKNALRKSGEHGKRYEAASIEVT